VAQFSLERMTRPTLLAVPNVSEGRDARVIATIAAAFADAEGSRGGPDAPARGYGQARGSSRGGARLLDVHSDPDHDRSVFTLAGGPGELAQALMAGARATVELVDVMGARPDGEPASGQHPRVGALDVAPIVYLQERDRGAACAEALAMADRIGEELGVPVFLYGELTGDDPRATRAQLRRGGVRGLAARMAGGGSQAALEPAFGPARMHPSAGATLVAARAPLVAFNLQLSPPATLADARRIAALIREGGAEGLPGVRAMAVELGGRVAQVSMNVERPLEIPLAVIVQAVARHADLASGEIVGLAPAAALEVFPRDVPLQGFDPARQVIEKALGC
jgi:glutamate formiminotransferase / 5-formyltetrahydrofolate cyclo-ligase